MMAIAALPNFYTDNFEFEAMQIVARNLVSRELKLKNG